MPIGALVKLADSGQIQVVDDEGKVFNPGNCPHSNQDLLSFLSNVM